MQSEAGMEGGYPKKVTVKAVYPKDAYNPMLHIRADELRAVGVEIPEGVPDCAYVPRTALVFAEGAEVSLDEDIVHVSLPMQINAYFVWGEEEYEIELADEEQERRFNEQLGKRHGE